MDSFNNYGGADFSSADAVTIALACVAVIVAFYALAKGCEKFANSKKERMSDAMNTDALTSRFGIVTTLPGGATASTALAGIVQSKRKDNAAVPGYAAVAALDQFGRAREGMEQDVEQGGFFSRLFGGGKTNEVARQAISKDASPATMAAAAAQQQLAQAQAENERQKLAAMNLAITSSGSDNAAQLTVSNAGTAETANLSRLPSSASNKWRFEGTLSAAQRERMSNKQSGGIMDSIASFIVGKKERFQIVDDKANSQRNANFVLGNRRERFDVCNSTGAPLRPGQTQSNCEGMNQASPDKLRYGPDGTLYTENMQIFGTDGQRRENLCVIQPDGTCREGMANPNHKHGSSWIEARGAPGAVNEIVYANPFLDNNSYGLTAGAREHFDANTGFIRTVDEVQYQCSPVQSTTVPVATGAPLSQLTYLHIVPVDAEQALSAELPANGVNGLNQAELTTTDATNVDMSQILLQFGPDEVTRDNVAITGEDGFIVRELKYRKKPVVLSDGVNTYTLYTLKDWQTFEYNPLNMENKASMVAGSAMENLIDNLIPNARVQTTGAYHNRGNDPSRSMMVTTGKSRKFFA
jgi:hypothetical protein